MPKKSEILSSDAHLKFPRINRWNLLNEDYRLMLDPASFYYGLETGAAMMYNAILKSSSATPSKLPSGPSTVDSKIYNLSSETYELIKPVPVTIERHPDEIIALMPDLNLYGEGPDEMDAIEDLKAEIIELFEDLDEMPNSELGKMPKIWKKTLRLMVKKSQ